MCIFDFLFSVSFLPFIVLCLMDLALLCRGHIGCRLCQGHFRLGGILFIFYSILTASIVCTYVVTIFDLARVETVDECFVLAHSEAVSPAVVWSLPVHGTVR